VKRNELLNDDIFAEEENNKYLKKIKNLTDELSRVTQQLADKEKHLENHAEKIRNLSEKIACA
jgi:chromosome segregation ATPase